MTTNPLFWRMMNLWILKWSTDCRFYHIDGLGSTGILKQDKRRTRLAITQQHRYSKDPHLGGKRGCSTVQQKTLIGEYPLRSGWIIHTCFETTNKLKRAWHCFESNLARWKSACWLIQKYHKPLFNLDHHDQIRVGKKTRETNKPGGQCCNQKYWVQSTSITALL